MPDITVIMPAFNAVGHLPRVLPPLLEMLGRGEIAELLVVDDCSTDATAQMAAQMGARVLTTPQNGGPGRARNLAAREAQGEILWFVDSDVIAAEGGAFAIREAMRDAQVVAVFGCYDDAPAAPGVISRYKNLVHRFHHANAMGEAKTFWAGCGAVRKSAFLAVDGFDVETYKVPSIEDIELGYRLTGAGGRILVVPGLEGKHLKNWSAWGAVHTDIFRRALPWARLIVNREGLDTGLNLGWGERLRAGLAGLWALSLLLMFFVSGLWGWALILLPCLVLVANARLFMFMTEAGGVSFGLKAVALHQIYLIYAAASFAWVLFEFHVLGRKNRLQVP